MRTAQLIIIIFFIFGLFLFANKLNQITNKSNELGIPVWDVYKNELEENK